MANFIVRPAAADAPPGTCMNPPEHATMCMADTDGIEASVVKECTDTQKCEYTCNEGYYVAPPLKDGETACDPGEYYKGGCTKPNEYEVFFEPTP